MLRLGVPDSPILGSTKASSAASPSILNAADDMTIGGSKLQCICTIVQAPDPVSTALRNTVVGGEGDITGRRTTPSQVSYQDGNCREHNERRDGVNHNLAGSIPEDACVESAYCELGSA